MREDHADPGAQKISLQTAKRSFTFARKNPSAKYIFHDFPKLSPNR
jgi:hypothetical protein